jgi:hypothetical protein
MSDETVGSVLRHKDTRYVQVRLDYMLLYRNETKAKIIRIMETWTAQKRADWYKQSLDAKEQSKEPPEDELWVTMSYEQFSVFAYGTVKHDNIKCNVDELVKEKHLLRRVHPTIPYGPPQYLLNIALLQKVLDEQELPSLIDDIGKIAPPRKKHTPPEKYPQGRGINTPRVGGIIPPGTGDFSYPSNNRTENSLDNTNNKDDSATSLQEDRTPAATIHDIEIMRQRKTDPRLPVVSSHSQEDTGNEKGQDENSTIHSHTADLLLPQSRAVGTSNQVGVHLDTQIDDDVPTEKLQAMPKQQTPDAGAAIPPSSSAGAQAPIVSPSSPDVAVLPTTGRGGTVQPPKAQAAPLGASDDHLNGGSRVIPKRPRSRKPLVLPVPVPETPQEALQIMNAWDELFKAPLARTDKHVKAAIALIPCHPSKDDLKDCKNWLFTTDNPQKPWFRKKGVSLQDIADNFGQWQSVQDVPQGEPKKDENIGVSGLPRFQRREVKYG